ncbi:MAG: 30S ribosomal protein S6e [Methanomicrobiales archaeon]|jgi:small subunit ribosomal protein S6e|nr:30S ribosomal protein S6e [Methanomicrobiales archaeon]
MADFKVVLSDTKTGKAYNVAATGVAASSFIGKNIGQEMDAAPLGFDGYTIKITGASDKNGTPARQSLPIAGRRRALVRGGVGFHPVMEGQRRRKMIRGSEITADFVQINVIVTKYGSKTLEQYFAPPEAQAEESQTEE